MFDWLPASTGGLTKDFCGHHDKHFLDLIFWGMRSNFISHLWFTYPNFTLSYVWGIQSILVRSLIAQQTDKSYTKYCIDGTIALPVNTQLSSASLPFFCCSFTTIWPQNQWWIDKNMDRKDPKATDHPWGVWTNFLKLRSHIFVMSWIRLIPDKCHDQGLNLLSVRQ